MTNAELMQLTQDHVMHTYGRYPVCIERGEGAKFYDFEGKEYIDFSSGIGVNALGTGNEAWVKAVTEQAGKLAHTSNLFYTEPGAKLAQQLTTRTGMKYAFFSNSGAESNEGIIKLARKYSYDKYGEGRATIITLEQSFHGRTVTTLKATGQDVFHQYFFPFTEGFRYAKANDIASVESVAGDDVCAVMVELIQGEGGVLPLEPEFVYALKTLCDKNDWLLLVDEVQTGVGRTGSLFAFQQYGILPDAVSFAKGIGGGLPLGGFMASDKVKDVLGGGTHATTFGANPICCAAALAVLAQIDDALLASVREKAAYIESVILGWHLPIVQGVRGKGLMIGIAVDGDNKALAAKCIEKGLLIITAGPVLRMLPPLTISYEEIDAGLAILKSVLEAE